VAKSERTKKQGRDYLTTTRAPSPPISLPDGRLLVTLRDAGNYITKLPKAKHETAEWQAAMEALIVVATLGGSTMFARIGVMRALNRHHVREFDLDRKTHHWGKAKAQDGSMTVWDTRWVPSGLACARSPPLPRFRALLRRPSRQ
jgi:hypothetical protein